MVPGPGALLLILASSLAFGSFDATRKHLTARAPALPLAAVLSLGQVPLFVAWLLSSGAPAPRAGYWPEGLTATALNFAGTLLYLRALATGALSITVPFLSFTPVFVALFGAGLLGERLPPAQWAGIVLVVVGALTLTLGRKDLRSAVHVLTASVREPGSRSMLLAALAWALGSIFDKRALQHAALPVHGLVLSVGLGVLALGVLAARRKLGTLRRVRYGGVAVWLGVGLACAAQTLQLATLPLVPVSLYEACKRCVGMSMSVLNGAWFFGEPVTGRKLLGVGVMGVGVVLVLA